MRRPSKPTLLIVVAGQVVSWALAWRDLGKRSDDQVRGRKGLWRVFITINPGNSIAYWVAGRRYG